jgi:hypothetical protein
MTDDSTVGDNFIGSGEFLDKVMDLRGVDLFDLFGVREIGDLRLTRDQGMIPGTCDPKVESQWCRG